MNFTYEFVNLFKNMDLTIYILLIVGLVLVFIEIFQPGFGIFGIMGGLFLVASIIVRVVKNDGNILAQIFIMLFFISLIVVTGFLLMILMTKLGWLNRSALIETGTAVSTGFAEGTENYAFLIGKKGIAITPLRPGGNVVVENVKYDVVADGFFVEKDAEVFVESVEGVKIIVKKIS